jgi:hypothetical protein
MSDSLLFSGCWLGAVLAAAVLASVASGCGAATEPWAGGDDAGSGGDDTTAASSGSSGGARSSGAPADAALPPGCYVGSTECDRCLGTQCCLVVRACAKDATCARQLACVLECERSGRVGIECIGGPCEASDMRTLDLFACASRACGAACS